MEPRQLARSTRREIAVPRLIATGSTNEEIAD
jgi:DNA-binding NarL/FixJ family response regulator